MSTRPVAVESILAQPGTGQSMAASERVLQHVAAAEEEEYEWVMSKF